MMTEGPWEERMQTPGAPQNGPKRPQEEPKRGQGHPKTAPRGAQEGQKSEPKPQDEKRTEPRRPQDRLGPPKGQISQNPCAPRGGSHTHTRMIFRCENQEGWARSGAQTLGRDPPPGSPREAPQEPRGGHPGTTGPLSQAPRHSCARSKHKNHIES
jgi:hypothetical protein